MAIIALAAGVVAHAKGATPASAWLYRAYETAEGLPDMSITGLAQTTDGYLWVATKGGLLRFNGEEFATLSRSNFPVMPSRAVRAMFRDHRDQLWLAMERGPLLCLKPDGLQSFWGRDGLPGGRVLVMAEDRENSLWVAYPDQLRRIVNGQLKSVALPPDSRELVNLVVASDGRGNIWCAKGRDLSVWREGKWEVSVWVATDSPRRLHRMRDGQVLGITKITSGGAIRALSESADGTIWMGTSVGSFKVGMDGIRCRIEMPMQLPKQPLSAEIRHNLSLAFKEALNNVLKHAEASEVRISLTLEKSGFALSVADNGQGFSPEGGAVGDPGQEALQRTPGNGLANMRARLRESGGLRGAE